jgi:pimeloyl-ACP methyl ester carboxylesterase
MMSLKPKTIVLIHGLWMTPCSWRLFQGFYEARGYRVLTPPWPRLHALVEEARREPDALAGLGVREIVDHYDAVIRTLDDPPILIGHSFGGLIVQILLDRGLGAAGVSLDGTAPKGIWTLPLSVLKAANPVLSNPLNYWRTVMLTFEQFRYAFANTMTESAAREAYERDAIPGPGRPIFQAAFANFVPGAATTVNHRNGTRPPLLLISGAEDHLVPAILNRLNYEKYAGSGAVTAYQEFPGRSHLLVAQDGWEEVAEYALSWAQAKTSPSVS